MGKKLKYESWLEELYPGSKEILEHYSDLTLRELAIVSAAIMEAALAQLILKRLVDDPTLCS